MASWEEVRRIALTLPETTERLSRDLRQWRVRDKLFAGSGRYIGTSR